MNKNIHFLAFLLLPYSISSASKEMCNSQLGICNKRYNEIIQIVSHNATSNTFSLVQNQDRSLTKQLQDGIRAFKVPVHYDYQNRLGYYKDLLQSYRDYLNSSLSQLSATNPKYWSLAALKQIVNGALAITQWGGPDASKRSIFACHGLGKRMLYEKYIDQIVDQAPSSIKPVIKKIAGPIQSAISKATEVSFGKKEEIGGALPFAPCILDTSRQKFTEFLTTLREFLDKNPREVITLFLDDWTYNPADVAKDFEYSGLISYVHTQSPDLPWPTFKELIESNKRIVVFIDRNVQHNYPWLHSTNFYDGWPAKWEYKSVSDLTNKNFTIQDVLKNPALQNVHYEYPHNKFFSITHQVTPGLAGSKSAAKIVNAKDVLSYRIKKITEMMGRKPNFISVDFYEYPNNDVLEVVTELNKE